MIITWSDAALVRGLQLEGQQVPHVELLEHGQSLQEPVLVKPQRLELLGAVGVDGASVQHGGDLVELLPGPDLAVVPQPRLGADEVHAAPLVLFVEVVVTRDVDREAVGVLGAQPAVTTLGSLPGPRVLATSSL